MCDCYRFLFKSVVVVFLACCMILGSSGCQKAAVKEGGGPVFFPAPPDLPRMQFLTSYSGSENFDVEKPSFLETFVLGEDKVRSDEINKPYGVAIHDGKIYICDVVHKNIKVLDIVNNKFGIFPSGRSLSGPVNIFIEPDGTKYIADPVSGTVSVWSVDDKLIRYLGKDLEMMPLDVCVKGDKLYIVDTNNSQVLVLDKRSGELLQRIGKKGTDVANVSSSAFLMITGLTVDEDGDVYASDKLNNRVIRFNADGERTGSYGRPGNLPGSLVRAKGVAVDKEKRVWVVDAGPAMAVKVYRQDGQLLMLFGFPGKSPGQMYLPAGICIDYDHVDLFKKYVAEGAKIDFLVLVTNQFGPNKVSVYGFGTFPKKYSQPVVEETKAG